MNEQELREGLARDLCRVDIETYCLWESEDELIWGDGESFSTVDGAVKAHWRSYTAHATAAIAYIRQHDGHAEFVRAVRDLAQQASERNYPNGAQTDEIAHLCNVELEKGQNNET